MSLDHAEELEQAAAVFHTMSLVQLRRSHAMLLQLDQAVIERFVEKYSDFTIFLLSVADRHRARELLERLTDHSLIYIAEEELRAALIREIAAAARDGRDFLDFSLFLDLVDRPPGDGPLPDCVASVLKVTAQQAPAGRSLSALESVPGERLRRAFRGILIRNRAVALGMVAFASGRLRHAMMDAILLDAPALLVHIPAALFFDRFRENAGAYMAPALRGLLPASVQQALELRDRLLENEKPRLETLRLLAAEAASAERRSRALDIVIAMMEGVEGPAADLLLQEVVNLGALEEGDLDLLRRYRQSPPAR